MIFSKKSSSREYQTEDKKLWKKRFALFPACVYIDNTGKMYYLWMGFYETREYYERESDKWWRENRLPSSANIWREEVERDYGPI